VYFSTDPQSIKALTEDGVTVKIDLDPIVAAQKAMILVRIERLNHAMAPGDACLHGAAHTPGFILQLTMGGGEHVADRNVGVFVSVILRGVAIGGHTPTAGQLDLNPHAVEVSFPPAVAARFDDDAYCSYPAEIALKLRDFTFHMTPHGLAGFHVFKHEVQR
jgi:hypothetical protein